MTEFEYLAVLISIILGLGITHLLAGVGQTIHRRDECRLDAVHATWTAVTFSIIVLNWWVFFQSRTVSNWSFGVFLVVIVWAVQYYLMSVVLYPPDMAEGEGYGEVFERNRRWFLGLFCTSALTDIGLTALRGDLFDPPQYLPFASHFVVLGIVGLVVKSRRFHLFFAAYVLVVLLTWSLLARRLLGV
jgi:hypothetical protein